MVLIDLLQKITTPITCKSGRSTIGTATGFFFRFNSKTFLITNRHVFIKEETNYFPDTITIRLNKEGTDLTQSEEIVYKLHKTDGTTPLWLELKKEIDIVALEIADPTGFVFASLAPENLANPHEQHLGLGEQVLVIGYPRAFYDTTHNLPIVRSANVASVYGLPFQKNPFFLVDSKLHPGTSGSPVITVPKTIYQNSDGGLVIGGRPVFHFLGINSGSFGDLDLNAIWYSNLVIDLLNQSIEKLPPAGQESAAGTHEK